MYYKLTEQEKTVTKNLVTVMKDTIKNTDTNKVVSFVHNKKKKIEAKMKAETNYLKKQGFDMETLKTKAENLGAEISAGEISIKGIFKTMKEWWGNRNAPTDKKTFPIFVSLVIKVILFSVIQYVLGSIVAKMTGSLFLLSKFVCDFTDCCIAAPIAEECAKRSSIKDNNVAQFWARFNFIEAVIVYILPFAIKNITLMFCPGSDIIGLGVNLGIYIVCRFLGVMFHTLTTKIQLDQTNKGSSKKGLFIGIVLHFIINLFAILLPVSVSNIWTSTKWLSISALFDASFLFIVSKIYTKLTSKKEENTTID